MGHKLLTPRYLKDWHSFVQLAEQCHRFKENKADGKRVYERITGHTDFMHTTQAVLTQLAAYS